MKCVKHLESGKITRLTDDLAEALVKSGSASYTNKQAWKRAGRP